MLIDSHCHLPHKKYEIDLPTILQQARDNGVSKLINIGTSIKENIKVIKTLKNHNEIYGSIGIYPHEDQNKTLDELEQFLEKNVTTSKKIIGIGECGIDITNLKGGRNLEDQLELFEMQLSFAEKNNLPVIVHNRNGDKYVLKMLKRYSGIKGVAHGFRSTWETAKGFLDLGIYISFAANISYPSNDYLRDILKKVPNNMFVIETDSPYLPPQSHRGEVNYPKYVKIIAEKIATVKQIPFTEICRITRENTCSLFNI